MSKYVTASQMFKVLPLSACVSLLLIQTATAATTATNNGDTVGVSADRFTVTLPTIVVETTSEQEQTQGYVNYDQANVTRNDISVKETPHSIETINIQKNKLYGTNDLSSIVEGNAGVDATYDMRGESIKIRGFSADASDIYRDGIRASGQVRRSTANIERVEILKGPASVLYGRSKGGGVINMVSKKANFTPRSSVGVRGGSWSRMGASVDSNHVVNDNLAVRLNADYEQGDSFRSGVEYKNTLVSPSVLWVSDDGNLSWEGQYTYDNAWRVPDRNPDKDEYDAMGIDYDVGFAHPGDEVTDQLHFVKSAVRYDFHPDWSAEWNVGYLQANQDFDHFYSGSFDKDSKKLTQSYAWQETDNKTLSNSLVLLGDVNIGNSNHRIVAGYDFATEDRIPLVGYKRNYATIDPYDKSTWEKGQRSAVAPVFDNHHQGTSHSIFAQDVFDLPIQQDVKVSVGGRYDRYKFESEDIKHRTNHYDGSTFSPNAGVVWAVTPEHSVYGSYSQSFAPYGGNGNLGVRTSSDPKTFNTKPERNDQYEVGVKSDWLDGKLSTTAALYQVTHYDIRYRPDPDNDPFTYAIRGEEQSRGIDINVLGQIMPQWYVRGSLGFMDAKIVEDKSKPANEGKYLSNTSRHQGNFFVRYVPNDTWYGEVGVTHSGKRYNYNRDGSDNHLDGFTRVDAMLGYQYNKQLGGTIALHNLFDEQYWRSSSMPGQPRSIMARLNYEF